MKSIKPGRGPSFMSAVGGFGAAIFGVIWTILAISMGAPPFFALFGVVFIAMAVIPAIYNLKNATSENRYSSFDIVDGDEEPDPLNLRFGGESGVFTDDTGPAEASNTFAFCPYCGMELEEDFAFCPRCGRELNGN